MSFEIILPFLRPIKHLLEAETVSEIMINPDSSVCLEEAGEMQLLPGIRFDDGALQTGLEVIAISELDVHFASGWRIQINAHIFYHLRRDLWEI